MLILSSIDSIYMCACAHASAGYFAIPELRENTYPRISIDGEVMAIAMQDAGFVLYSIEDPLAPVRISDEVLRFEPSPNATAAKTTPYTLGVLQSQYVRMPFDGQYRWVLLVSDDGVHAQLKIVDYISSSYSSIEADVAPVPELDSEEGL